MVSVFKLKPSINALKSVFQLSEVRKEKYSSEMGGKSLNT